MKKHGDLDGGEGKDYGTETPENQKWKIMKENDKWQLSNEVFENGVVFSKIVLERQEVEIDGDFTFSIIYLE